MESDQGDSANCRKMHDKNVELVGLVEAVEELLGGTSRRPSVFSRSGVEDEKYEGLRV